MTGSIIRRDDLVTSIADALQYIAVYHPPDFLAHLARALKLEQSPAARDAIKQILVNSRMAAIGRRPICQDTGTVNVFLKVGMQARFDFDEPIAEVVNEAVAIAYTDAGNPLRASIVADPLFDRRNTRTNAPAVTHVELVAGSGLDVHVAAKGGGSENKASFAALNPGDDVADWVVRTVERLGAGWCPPGILGIGVGGTAEKAMLLAKESLLQPIDMTDLLARGPRTAQEEMRVDLYRRVNALGIGAQGLGGLTTVLDVKIATYPVHAASMPVALIPQCVADRHIGFRLDGGGPAGFVAPRTEDWPQVALDAGADAIKVDLDRLAPAEVAGWRAGETLLLSGRLLTGRDAAHKRLAAMLERGEDLPVDLKGRAIYYVGPVDAVAGEAVGPAGPTTSTRMDPYTDILLERTGLLVMIGKAERGDETVASIGRHGAAYLIAVGGAAYLVSKAVRSAKVIAFDDLGMEAIHEFVVEDMPVTVAVDAQGQSIHKSGPMRWRAPPVTYHGTQIPG
ncbi:fumarase, class I, homodimeric [Aureimonas altamirensis DSM 21988]|uniref:Fumarate hydratase class I n=2 Tax=Aureimonas altamirensis TaxID=370622 RepID=A0A0P0YWQ4_9HYPH|nr:fumarate hydratase [Aureimonas altamirensis]BAT25829.1 tartrate/fumarate family Fe-S type hydro-lyase [Aureimonas altamirensis]SHI49033.1 fumarase, class I, homodimeric [Aureimonas altamirensis DSM 21988]